MSVIAVVDCGMGNLHSVVAGIQRADADASVRIVDTPAAIASADKVILPGDGHFDACMRAIDARDLRHALVQAVREKPFFGICVGMQVLFAGSEEADSAGLAVLEATVRRLPATATRKVPHMGWNETFHYRRAADAPTATTDDGARFYYVHSYYAPLGDWTLMSVNYGVEFSAIIGGDNWLATQFHPEKSGAHGIHLLRRFIGGR